MTESAPLPSDGSGESRLAEAQRALARGWSLIRVRGKVPVDEAWQNGAPAPEQDMTAWVSAGFNLGLRTGKSSGVVVIDDDSEDGSASAAMDLPPTVTVITGSGKRHLYFRAPDFPVSNSVKSLAEGIDVRGDGGQVVFVGSIHPDTGQPYTWADGLSPDEVELASLPEHILERLRPIPPRKTPKKPRATQNDVRQERLRQYVEAAIDSEVDAVANSVEGTRNDTLNRAAFSLGQLVGADALDRERAANALLTAAIAAGLSEREAEATIRSGLDAGEGDPRDLDALHRERASNAPPEDDPRPRILLVRGWLHVGVSRAEHVLLGHKPPIIYQRGTTLVRVAALPSATYGQAILPQPFIVEVTANALIDKLTQLIRWERDTKEGTKVIDCPERVATILLSRAGSWTLPALTGVIDCPTLRSDGGILATEGYDPQSGLYLTLCSTTFPPIPERPSRAAAVEARDRILDLLKGFPFLTDADKSVAVCAILTSLIRPSLRTAPLFAFRAAKMGSGKSLLADVVSMIAAGRPAAVMSQGADENEDKKRFLPILAEGDPVAVIDNIERPFGSAALCSILTQPTWRDRVLGKSQTLSLPTTNTTWIATGNNIQFVGDITTRTLVCDLDPQCERPEEREFEVNLHEHIPAHRGELVAAGLTILRAYVVAGRPRMNLTVFGRFEEWSEWVRSAVVWAGLADPCDTRRRVEESDPVRDELGGLLAALHDHFSTSGFKVADALAVAEPGGPLHDALQPILATGRPGQAPAQRVGGYFRSVERRIEGGLRLRRDGKTGGSARWRIEHVAA